MTSILLLIMGWLALPASAFAPDNAGATAAPILQIPLGARALGMGTAFTAVASDVSALYYNPAGLSRLNAQEASASFSMGLADTFLNHFAYGGPLRYAGIAGNGYASAGASVLYSHNGSIEINRTKADGSFLSSEKRDVGWDLVATLGYSERLAMIPIDFNRVSYDVNHFLGVSGKIIHSSLIEQYAATAYAADMGYLITVPAAGLSAGFSALNFGNKMTFQSQGDPLPATLRFGAAYEWGRTADHNFTVAADGDYLVYDKLWHANTGVEYLWQKTYAMRLGYQYNLDRVGISIGMGLKWESKYFVDYAWTSAAGSGLQDTHRLTFSYRFGGIEKSIRATTRRPYIEDSEQRKVPRVIDSEPPDRSVPEKPAQKPRPAPKQEERPGVPGWIY